MPHTFTLSPETQASLSEIVSSASGQNRRYTSAAIQAAISFSHKSNRWHNIFSRMTFLNPGAASPQTKLLNYGNDIYLSEIVSVEESIKRINLIASGIWRCGGYDVGIVHETYSGQVNLIPKHERITEPSLHSSLPADYYEVHAIEDVQYLPESRYLSSAITIYPSMEALILGEFQADLWKNPDWRGIIQIFLPDYSAG